MLCQSAGLPTKWKVPRKLKASMSPFKHFCKCILICKLDKHQLSMGKAGGLFTYVDWSSAASFRPMWTASKICVTYLPHLHAQFNVVVYKSAPSHTVYKRLFIYCNSELWINLLWNRVKLIAWTVRSSIVLLCPRRVASSPSVLPPCLDTKGEEGNVIMSCKLQTW